MFKTNFIGCISYIKAKDSTMPHHFFRLYLALISLHVMFSMSVIGSGTASTGMNVTAIVAGACSITATDASFGTISGIFTTAINAPTPGGISVLCTNGDDYIITINAGLNANSDYRQMVYTSNSTTYNIEYALYSDSGYSTLWGDGTTFGNGVSGTGTGAVEPYTVYAQIPIQTPTTPPIGGSYIDSVQVTITF
jgi:spore coat protein U-like protein